MTIGDRIKQIRGEISQHDFGSKYGIGRDTIGRYEVGKTYPGTDFVEKLCIDYNINPTWLILGSGSMHPEDASTAPQATTTSTSEAKQHAETSTTDIGELLITTHKVLNSKTVYRKALESNIIAFGRGVDAEMKMDEMGTRIEKMEALLQELVDAKRTEQSPEKKSRAA